jgi:hypothetical protein
MPEMNVEDFKFPDENRSPKNKKNCLRLRLRTIHLQRTVGVSLCLNLW